MLIMLTAFAIPLRASKARRHVALPLGAFIVVASHAQAAQSEYRVRSLVSDGSVPAQNTDPDLVNAWGLASSPSGPWWVANNGTGTSTTYDSAGESAPIRVDISNGADPSPVTGMVFNGSTEFVISDGTSSGPATFLFASEDGTINGWANNVPPGSRETQVVVDNSGSGAIYKGLALGGSGGGLFLYAADFHNARIDVFDSDFQPATMEGDFTDSTIPEGFAPFNIVNIQNRLYVTYAKQDAAGEDDVKGKHLGFVNVFDTEGRLIKRLIKRGRLNAPWGVAMAPGDFGQFRDMLLVGNFGDGKINAYDPDTGKWRGVLKRSPSHTIVIDGLWALEFGNGGQGGSTNSLFFTAGPQDEEGGQFGRINLRP